ncbi:hypothetical protein [Rhodopseudomonas palustris]|uniref:Transmembrane protein n=1 Tax=Rhodopseudomonas palustris (strain BisB18) TaxID=316056 RepID=Q212J9_RHOPB
MSDDVSTPIPRVRRVEFASAWIVALVVPLLLLMPAFWNAYPLLQYDTGGYLARWYEGYLVPSRSTVFGLYLHFGESSYFWINLGVQALATLWILQLTLRLFGIRTPLRIVAVCLALILTTALPWLTSMLLTDIFAGLAVLSLFIVVVQGDNISRLERGLLMLFTAFAAATHSATLGVLLGLCCAALLARPLLGRRIPLGGLVRGLTALAASVAMLLAANFALSGQLAWTPGGVGVAFGRMLQDGIVARYLNDHCATQALKLCPYRAALPATADDFLWGQSMFNTLGRFQGMDDEMGFIALHALADYPAWQAEAALAATAQQLTHVATGEGTNGWIPHTYGIIERYLPGQVAAMRAARQQHWDIDFPAINRVHVPVALGSMLLLTVILGNALWRRNLDDLSLLSATVCLALIGNAAICGVISGPHDRYGARMVWLASFVVLIAANRWFDHDSPHGRRDRKSSTPSL